MIKINNRNDLQNAIRELESKQSADLILLKQQIQSSYESTKLINIIKGTIQKIAADSDIKDNLVNGAIGMGTGFAFKKVLVGSTNNPVKKIFGSLLQMAVASQVAGHADGIKAVGHIIIDKLFSRKKQA